jgi:hypothetical protein
MVWYTIGTLSVESEGGYREEESDDFIRRVLRHQTAFQQSPLKVRALYFSIYKFMQKFLIPMRSLDFSLQPHYGPGVDSASNRNEYQEFT